MKGRPKSFQNDDVLLKAQQVFWEKGYTAASLSDLQAATGLGAGSFYNAFKGGKKELFMIVLQRRRDAFRALKSELEKSESPMDLIRYFFKSMAQDTPERHAQGCIVANTVVEMTFVDVELEQEAVDILKELEAIFAAAIKKAQHTGLIKNKTDAIILARYLITLWNGLNVTRRMYPDKSILKKQIEMQLEVLK